MKKKKFKFPDFDKMTYEEEANWWDAHSLADFWDELEDVDIVLKVEKIEQTKKDQSNISF